MEEHPDPSFPVQKVSCAPHSHSYSLPLQQRLPWRRVPSPALVLLGRRAVPRQPEESSTPTRREGIIGQHTICVAAPSSGVAPHTQRMQCHMPRAELWGTVGPRARMPTGICLWPFTASQPLLWRKDCRGEAKHKQKQQGKSLE